MKGHSLAPKPVPVTRRYACHRPHRRIPPDRRAWFTWLCERCSREFKMQGIGRHCAPRRGRSEALGIDGIETVGAVSGS